jgi:diguanylate cyclase (GGDEF)-like protein
MGRGFTIGGSAMVLILLLYASWQFWRWIPMSKPLVGDIFFWPVNGLASIAAWQASRKCAGSPRLVTAWRLISVALASYLAGDVAQTVYELLGHRPYPSVEDVFYLLFYPLMMLALLRLPTTRRSGTLRWQLPLDLAIVAIGGSTVVWYLVLGPTAVAGGQSPLQAAFSIAYPSGDMILLVGLASVRLRELPPEFRRALAFMTAGVLFWLAADLVYGWLTLNSTYEGGDPVDSLWMVAIALFGFSAWAQLRVKTKRDEQESNAPVTRRRASMLPYLAPLVAGSLLVVSQWHEHFFPQLSLVVSFLVIAVLVSTRQFLAHRTLDRQQRELRAAHEKLLVLAETRLQANTDELTGLANRRRLYRRLDEALTTREPDENLALLMVDLDRFKEINDALGHGVGDDLLRQIGPRLADALRPDDVVARIGGDEFAILLAAGSDGTAAETAAERIEQALGEPFALGDVTLHVDLSIGIALCPEHASTRSDLLRCADVAMYSAKRGRRGHATYSEATDFNSRDRLLTLEQLRHAIARRELICFYQPKVELATGRVTGAESLVRWQHPERGLLAPGAFLPLAEQAGLMGPITDEVLDQALAQCKRWRALGHDLTVAVNLSASTLLDATLITTVRRLLHDHGLPPSALEIEITENALMTDPERSGQVAQALANLGVGLSIDDYGTGHSSLAYLRDLPVDELKLDRTFITDVTTHTKHAAIVKATAELAHSLDLRLVAEGIETEDDWNTVRKLGADTGQGYFIARPQPPGDFTAWLSEQAPAVDGTPQVGSRAA